MREADRDPGRLLDILKAAGYIKEFVDGCTYESFAADKMRFFAVLKNTEIIGEAAYMLTPSFKEHHPEVPWSQIIKMRHVLVHGYATVLPEILWQTATVDVPQLIEAISIIMERSE